MKLILAISIFIGFSSAGAQTDSTATQPMALSVMPIVMYDSDIGVGFGGKSVIKDSTKLFDLIVFGSTKGEQWYAFTFSTPDPETRHGRIHKVSFDSKVEYEKVLKSGYFGIGNNAKDNDYQFPRETFTLQSSLGYSFWKSLAGLIAFRFAHFAVYNYDTSDALLSPLTPGTGESKLLAASVAIRFDTRDSETNPKTGIRINVNGEKGAKALGSDWNCAKLRSEFSAYHPVFGKRDIAAIRLWIQKTDGIVPFQELSAIGDGWTARGFKAGRFLDRGMTLTSIEYRFPIYKKLGGVSFIDAGRVWHAFSDFSSDDWHHDYGGGLRYYLANFLVRLDIGHSIEGTRIFFNFGQVF